MNLANRLKAARKHAGISQEELALRIGVSQSLITKIERGLQGTTTLTVKIALACGVSVVWLDDGTGEMLENKLMQEYTNYETVKTGKLINQVPLISWVEAGNFNECVEDLRDCEMISTDAKTTLRTFALRIFGDSMQPLFQPGMILIVEPTLVAISGDYVIAKNGNDEATFKQLIQDGSDWYLKPLNDRYPLKSANNIDIVGVVIQSVTKFK